MLVCQLCVIDPLGKQEYQEIQGKQETIETDTLYSASDTIVSCFPCIPYFPCIPKISTKSPSFYLLGLSKSPFYTLLYIKYI